MKAISALTPYPAATIIFSPTDKNSLHSVKRFDIQCTSNLAKCINQDEFQAIHDQNHDETRHDYVLRGLSWIAEKQKTQPPHQEKVRGLFFVFVKLSHLTIDYQAAINNVLINKKLSAHSSFLTCLQANTQS
ncbi:hypothetical protein [Endozoicomonas numazuensis]|uniref:Uncharacterized protein n=1 Tax=Endozoicomonas numazuensis TaxID=1137799 RepID=A0A081NMX2_9GAMM|nr:hypothetical protein [Endozoicomonas numazuensis]KEQ19795.1 hypothetical protein GZ78_08000 [Endozoicomonas numazuensis]